VAYFVSKVLTHPITVRPGRPPALQTEEPPERACPTLLLCRRMIVAAFHDALEVDWQGLPTERGREAVEWITARADWCYWKKPTPPPELREEFWGSFEWACRWLGIDPETTRRDGPAREHGNVQMGTSFNDFAHVAGVGAIQAHWAARRARYLENREFWDAKEQARREREAAKRERYAAAKREKEAEADWREPIFAAPAEVNCVQNQDVLSN